MEFLHVGITGGRGWIEVGVVGVDVLGGPTWHLGARGDRLGPFCLPFNRKTGFWEVCWPLVGLLSFLVGRIQMDHFWEKLPEKIQDAQLIWISDQQIMFFSFI